MKQQIEPAYATFEQAKWLKEKRFNVPCVNYYTPEFTEHGFNTPLRNSELDDFYSAPEQWQIVEWALQVHKIFISVMPYDTINSAKEWTVSLFDLEFEEDKEIHYLTKIGGCNSYHEAISKGIDEFLKRI
jgi:hypothetical protein